MKNVDLLLLGGTVSGCLVALEAKARGAEVFGATSFSYFGEDLCAYLDLQSPQTEEFRALFGGLENPSPMQIKSVLDRKMIDANIDYLFGSHPVALLKDANGGIAGAVIANRSGFQAVTARVILDATGNADLATAAGAECAPLIGDEPAVQGAGVAPVRLGSSYENSDYSFSCDSDVVDSTRFFTMAHDKFRDRFDISQMIGSRERRRVVGDLTLQPQDFFVGHTYADTINLAMSNFDTHGYIVHPLFLLKAAEHQPYYAKVPLRALLPRGLEGILVTGLAVSAHRDCMPQIRMQPDLQNQGYAAGIAAAMAAEAEIPELRRIDIRYLQKLLIAKRILPANILWEMGSPGVPPENSGHCELAAVFQEPEKARERLRREFTVNPSLHMAHILAFLGDASGKAVLEETVRTSGWDEGWNYTGMGQFGPSLSFLDSLLMVLNNIGGSRDIILEKLQALRFETEFSHIRTVCMNLIAHPNSRAVAKLTELLGTPEARGNAVCRFRDVLNSNRPDRNDTTLRNAQLKELYLARALHSCDPENIQGRQILSEYANSMQACYALLSP